MQARHQEARLRRERQDNRGARQLVGQARLRRGRLRHAVQLARGRVEREDGRQQRMARVEQRQRQRLARG